MASTLHTSWIDFSLEPSNNRLVITQITSGNLATILSEVDTLLAAMQGITTGQLAKSKVSLREQNQDTITPTDPEAQREKKWLVHYSDTVTGKKYRTEIPTADLTGGNLNTNSDEANLADTQIAAFVTAFEAVVRDPATGLNTVNVDKIIFVGKRL